MIITSVSEAVPLTLVLWDGATTLYPRAKVYADATLVATVPLVHVAEGYYLGAWVPGVTGQYSVVYTVYTDAGFLTTAPTYEKAQDRVLVLGTSLDATAGGAVRQSFTFDTAANTVVINAWLEIGTAVVTSGVTAATITLFDSVAGVLSPPAPQALPVGQGVFRFVLPNPGLPIGEFATFSLATITYNATQYKGITGVTFSRAT